MPPLPSGEPSHVVLEGSRRYHRAGSEVLGPADPAQECDVIVKVRRKAELPEPDPARPISRARLVADYGADPADLDSVARVLTPLGLTVKSKDEATHSVELTGSIAAMEAAFGVKLSEVRHDQQLYRGRVGPLHIPKELDGIVTGVFGLDTRPMIKHRRRHRKIVSAALPPATSRPWFTPEELAEAYHFPAGDGSGQTVAILEFGGQYVAKDLQTFLGLVGLAAEKPSVLVRQVRALPPNEASNPDATGEVMLDVEVVAGACPKATIVVLFSPFTEAGWIANIDAILTDPAHPSIASISYGLAEGSDIWTQDAIDQVNDTLKALANAGITACVSSGDDGSDDQVADGLAHVDFPASSPYVLAVGGTSLDKSTGEEVAWFEGDGLRRDGGGSTGGGVSAYSPRPSWQLQNVPSANPRGPAGRIVPDVAANAAGSTGYLLVAPDPQNPSKAAPQVAGGTSAAAPLWAALLARLAGAGKVIGFLPPKLYQASPTSAGQPVGSVACRDITTGQNASGTAPGYSASVSFDAVTGWGSPIGDELLARLP